MATTLFDSHDAIYRSADDVSAQITTVLAQMVERIKLTQTTKIPGSIIRDENIAQVADYRIELDGQCSILINSNYVRNSGNEELGAVFAMQYAHCLYRDEHRGLSEHDAWKQVYRADGFAAMLFSKDGIKASCVNEHDSGDTPGCDRRIRALNDGNESYRAN